MKTQTSHRRVWRGGSLRGRSGTEVLEMALILPLLLLLAFGTVEFGYWFYLEHNFQAAAREGVRAGIVAGVQDNQRAQLVQDAVNGFMQQIKMKTYNIDPPTIIQVNGVNYLKVRVWANWKDVGVDTGLIIKEGNTQTDLVHANQQIAGEATMRIES